MKDKENQRNWVSKKKFLLMYDEESVKLRRSRVKGVGMLMQVETLHVLTRRPLDVPTRKRMHFPGSNKSEGIAVIKLQPWSECWSLPFNGQKTL